ncbi:Uncharacterised protein [Mesomycoplasma conjunctivae]|uniref:Uncharacterized protein n=1 Tax=Mesomycoplasma conjunctivae (strain ATCC 25834 / NCTC 10147 / HRC/581) TaxID=572263 RepID=C5J6V2_MESCH|nr:hypothetical protein [Mesomycoplasma conjunctivae]CAT05215.1 HYPOTHETICAL PROTEIN MCJ_005100 [Mesomycoplasma conjunctivae]VEU66427.1 Uncharacterised protein [Mesomycoplasma conjunctivae]
MKGNQTDFSMKKYNRKFVVGISAAAISISTFALVVGLSTLAKYNGDDPQKEVRAVASKVANVTFDSNSFSIDSNYDNLKAKLFDQSNNLKEDVNLNELIKFYSKSQNEELSLINYDTNDLSKPHFVIKDLSANDSEKNFELKYAVEQKFDNGRIASSDIYKTTIFVADFSQIYFNDFSAKVFTSLSSLNPNSISQFDKTKKENKFPALLRAQDFYVDINDNSKNASQALAQVKKYFTNFDTIFSSLQDDSLNKLGDGTNIYDFELYKNPATSQYVDLINGEPTIYVKIQYSDAAKSKLSNIDTSKFKIEAIKLTKNQSNNQAYFAADQTFQQINLANLVSQNFKSAETAQTTQADDIAQLSAYDFLNKVNIIASTKDSQNPLKIKDYLNSLLAKPLDFDYGETLTPFVKAGMTIEGLDYSFDGSQAKVVVKDDQHVVEIPATISATGAFYGDQFNKNKIVKSKQVTFNISGFKAEKLEKAATKAEPVIADLTKQYYYNLDPLPFFTSQANLLQEKELFGIFKDSPNKRLTVEEFDKLLKEKNYTKLKDIISNPVLYAYNFDNTDYKVGAWTGDVDFPSSQDFQDNFTVDTSSYARQYGVASLNSGKFFHNPSAVAAFYAHLVKQGKKAVVSKLLEIVKALKLVDKFEKIDLSDPNKILENAKKIKLSPTLSKEIYEISFNSQYLNILNQGYFSTLFLPHDFDSKNLDFASKIDLKTLDQTLTDKDIQGQYFNKFIDSNGRLTVSDSSKTDQNRFKLVTEKSTINVDNQGKEIFGNIKNTQENIKIFEKFKKLETFEDVILAFYYKAQQLQYFQAFSKIDSKLSSEIIFEEDKSFSSETYFANKPRIEIKNDKGETQKSKAIKLDYYYRIGYKNADNLIDKAEFTTPKQSIILHLVDEQANPDQSIINQLDQAIISIPSEFRNVTLSEEDYEGLEKKLDPSFDKSKPLNPSDFGKYTDVEKLSALGARGNDLIKFFKTNYPQFQVLVFQLVEPDRFNFNKKSLTIFLASPKSKTSSAPDLIFSSLSFKILISKDESKKA